MHTSECCPKCITIHTLYLYSNRTNTNRINSAHVHLIDAFPTEKTASIGSNVVISPNPSYMSLPRSPCLFISNSDSESDDDRYDTILDLKKLMPLPQGNNWCATVCKIVFDFQTHCLWEKQLL